MNKKFILCLVLVLILSFSTVAFGLSGSTYAALSQSSTNAQNLISYASNYNTFFNSEYVCYQGEQYQYYIVWGDLDFNNGVVSGTDVEYVMYYREGVQGNYVYTYSYNTDDKFSLNIDDSVVTNIQGAGGDSVLYNQLYFYEYGILLLAMSVGFLFARLIIRR